MTTTPALDALFIYGSLLEEAKRLEILGHRADVIEARLAGYERRHGRYFYIVPADEAETAGLVMLHLTDADWQRLDAYEELPTLYTRKEIEVVTSDGMVRCWVYLPTPKCINLKGESSAKM
jgi:gamma-glutamylcyclotransferase (GGCT)/AIG2-like uncharacterized protein YtfP